MDDHWACKGGAVLCPVPSEPGTIRVWPLDTFHAALHRHRIVRAAHIGMLWGSFFYPLPKFTPQPPYPTPRMPVLYSFSLTSDALLLLFPPLNRIAILSIDRFTTDLVTQGGPVNLNLRNIGYGRHIFSSPVNMSYTNGNFSYIAQNCHMQWNGSTVTCTAPPGVGRSHRWTMQLFGFDGFTSPPEVVTNYKGPILYVGDVWVR
jgi:hypothetical protein